MIMKIFLKITLLLISSVIFFFNTWNTFAGCLENWTCVQWVETTNISWYNWWTASRSNTHLNAISWNNSSTAEFAVSWWKSWDQWIYNFIVRIARDLKNLVFTISVIYFFIIVFQLLTTENTEEQMWKFKKWIIWISIWIFIMQIAYTFVLTLSSFNWWVIWQSLWWQLYKNVIDPVIRIIELWASFVFIAISIYAFYKMVTANWDEAKAKSWKMTIFYAILWFIVIKISRAIVQTVYWKINCESVNKDWFSVLFVFQNEKCIEPAKLSDFSQIVLNIINWMNTFVWIITLIMVIYAWAQVFLSWWDEEKLKKAKKSIIYIALWLWVLVVNYLILSFFFTPERII